MPELPEVTTTVDGLRETVVGKKITDIWTDWKKHIKFPSFEKFKGEVVGKTIIFADRRGKNILLNLSGNKTILIHMKMTGHLLYGHYKKEGRSWVAEGPGPLRDDPYNKYVHFLVTLSNKKHLAFSDLRKFGKILLLETDKVDKHPDLKNLGPDALEVSKAEFKDALLKKKSWKIKQALMNQELVSGIGNIYSDELLWNASVHPLSRVGKIMDKAPVVTKLYNSMRLVLNKGIDFGGDSDSDYRNIYGKPGKFQEKHRVYRKTGEKCSKHDGGEIKRVIVGSRSAHFCPKHQKLYK